MRKISETLTIEDFPCFMELEAPKDLSVEKQLDMYYKMNAIRFFDTKVKDLWMAGTIYGLAHSYVAAEAVAVGTCAALDPADYITSTHRGHGHTLAKGADINKMMAELLGKYEGYNRGKGGSMHIADVENGMLGATGIVGSGMPIALGAALSADVLGNGKVSICFHGDGGTNQGVWHESLNMAAAWNLPVIYVIENNQMAIATPLCTSCQETELYKRAAGYGIPGVVADGFNVFDVYKHVKQAVDRARAGEGPTLIECRFLRLLGHFVADDQWYRDLKAVEKYWELDPIKRMKEYFIKAGTVSLEKLIEIEERARKAVEDSVEYGLTKCTEPPESTLYDDIYAHGEVII